MYRTDFCVFGVISAKKSDDIPKLYKQVDICNEDAMRCVLVGINF
jgi:hypothetical protein